MMGRFTQPDVAESFLAGHWHIVQNRRGMFGDDPLINIFRLVDREIFLFCKRVEFQTLRIGSSAKPETWRSPDYIT